MAASRPFWERQASQQGDRRPQTKWALPLVLASMLCFGADFRSCGYVVPVDSVPGRQPSRRGAFISAASSIAGFSAYQLDAVAKATIRGWQMKVTEPWQLFRSDGMPDIGETRPRELLVARILEVQAEVRVIRFPLVTSQRDPSGIGGLALVDYFSTSQGKTPRVTQEQAIDVLSKGFQQMPATFSFVLNGQPKDFLQGDKRYLIYEFDQGRCQGVQVDGVKGKECQRPDNGQVLDVNVRHHAMINTVAAETGDDVEGAREILWVVDISAPADKWRDVAPQVAVFADSFAVGTEAELAALRGPTNGTAPNK